ncbi:MAG TPA: ATP-binding protein [Mycobacteriales bacterium]|nr:ATP-binding protein [Mycobacteriales bacterium]
MDFIAPDIVRALEPPAAVLAPDGRLIAANAAWRAVGTLPAEPGAALPPAPPGPSDTAALAAAISAAGGPTGTAGTVVCGLRDGSRVRFRCAPLPAADGAGYALVTLDPDRTDRARPEFLATLSHAVRTPISGIVGMVDLLLALPLEPDVHEVVEGVRLSADALTAMLNDMVDLAQIEVGRLQLDDAPFDLRQLVDGVAETLGSRARQKGLAVVVRVTPQLPARLLGDDARLRQVLLNLVGNAIKFTEVGEIVLNVEVGADPTGAGPAPELSIEVVDSGRGMAPDALDRVFEPFVQEDASTARRHGGSGLGLAVTARLVRLMGGRVAVDSAPAVGSRFRVVLPLRQPDGAAPADRPDRLAGRRLLVTAPGVARSAAALAALLRGEGATVDVLAADPLAEVLARQQQLEPVDAVVWVDDARDTRVRARAAGLANALNPPATAATDPTGPLPPDPQPTDTDPPDPQPTGTDPTDPQPAGPQPTGTDPTGPQPAGPQLADTDPTGIGTTGTGAASVGMAGTAGAGPGRGRPATVVLLSRTDPPRRPPSGVTVLALPVRADRLLDAVRGIAPVPDRPVPIEPLPGGRVLLAEDNAVNRAIIGRMLDLLGLRWDSVSDGAAAVAAASTQRYDAILMDVQMPGTDGVEATRRIRAAESDRHTPIVALTANAMGGDRETYLAAGMDDYVPKPMRLATLRATLQRYVSPALEVSAADLDAARLADLATQLQDAALVSSAVELYLSELPGRCGTITEAGERLDRGGLQAAAHALKSASAMLGATAIADLCERLMTVAEDGTAADIRALTAAMPSTATRTEVAIRRYLTLTHP